jgi:hypothetical protein
MAKRLAVLLWVGLALPGWQARAAVGRTTVTAIAPGKALLEVTNGWGKRLLRVPIEGDATHDVSIARAPRGRFLALRQKDQVAVYDLAAWWHKRRFSFGDPVRVAVREVAWSPDGQYLLVRSQHQQGRNQPDLVGHTVYDPRDGKHWYLLDRYYRPGASFRNFWSPDGRLVGILTPSDHVVGLNPKLPGRGWMNVYDVVAHTWFALYGVPEEAAVTGIDNQGHAKSTR